MGKLITQEDLQVIQTTFMMYVRLLFLFFVIFGGTVLEVTINFHYIGKGAA